VLFHAVDPREVAGVVIEPIAAERWDLQPDLMCLGKAMGGGVMPIGALLGSERALGGFEDLSTGSTWSWLPGSCAAALATLDAFEDGSVLANVRALEGVARDVLGGLPDRFEQVGDVRVVGCFIAVELVTDAVTRERAPELQETLAYACLARGILGDSSTTSLNLQPSLVMPPDDLRRILTLVVDAVEEVLGS
jgi:4-aminobutyrate aminotransferase-like enzyme